MGECGLAMSQCGYELVVGIHHRALGRTLHLGCYTGYTDVINVKVIGLPCCVEMSDGHVYLLAGIGREVGRILCVSAGAVPFGYGGEVGGIGVAGGGHCHTEVLRVWSYARHIGIDCHKRDASR